MRPAKHNTWLLLSACFSTETSPPLPTSVGSHDYICFKVNDMRVFLCMLPAQQFTIHHMPHTMHITAVNLFATLSLCRGSGMYATAMLEYFSEMPARLAAMSLSVPALRWHTP